jgi:hypothetical protein
MKNINSTAGASHNLRTGQIHKIPRGFMDLKPTVIPSPKVFTEKHTKSVVLGRYVLAGEGGASGNCVIRAFVKTPSIRLNVGLRVGFEPDLGQEPAAPTFSTQPTWFITVISINPDTGRRVSLNQAYPSSSTAQLPDGYELNSACDMLQVTATLNSANFAASFLPNTDRANCVLIVSWEPNTEIPNDELRRLYSLCEIESSGPKLITNIPV